MGIWRRVFYIIAQSSIIAGVLSLLLAFADPLTAALAVFAVQSAYMILATIQFLQISVGADPSWARS